MHLAAQGNVAPGQDTVARLHDIVLGIAELVLLGIAQDTAEAVDGIPELALGSVGAALGTAGIGLGKLLAGTQAPLGIAAPPL